jgi:hypothetical protein
MTRFKELKRIEEAIARNQADLPWALDYCEMRRKLAIRKDHLSHWEKLAKRVKAAIASKK